MINNSYLLGLYGVSADSAFAFGNSASAPRKTQPTAPWAIGVKLPEPDSVVRAALAGRRLINEDAARLDLPGASSDYRKLFALYQGLSSLSALANRAGQRGVGTSELAQINKRFETGLTEVGDYLRAADFDGVRMVQGVSSTSAKTTAAVARDATRIVTRPIHDGSLSSAVAAFDGDVVFNITIGTLGGD